jgi:tripartite-type tricarboxylate transporter receptor subunit TctC
MMRIATLGTGLLPALLSGLASAQAWPAKPIKWVVPFAPGGTTDILARTVGDKLSVALGVPVIIENKPGAGGGAEFTARAAPDGYTIMGGTISTHAINASLMGGQVTMTFDNITTAWPLAKDGRLRALAVTTAKRSATRPRNLRQW